MITEQTVSMLPIVRAFFSLSLSAMFGCGPSVDGVPEWLSGTFSTIAEGSTGFFPGGVGRYQFREDGTVLEEGVFDCKDSPRPALEGTWTLQHDGEVEVHFPGDTYPSTWRVTPGDACDTVSVETIHDGQSLGNFSLHRGAVCLQYLGPCPSGTECDDCRSTWCDGPPACEAA